MLKARGADVRIRSRAAIYSKLLLIPAAAAGIVSAEVSDAAEPLPLAISNFDFRDTSGEVRDQTAEHERRLRALDVALQKGLSDSEGIKSILLTCQTGKCSARAAGLEALSTQARNAGARYLLIGEVHKMSTLVGWVKFAVMDLNSNKPACDRFLSYRGDTDEAWQHAAEFVVRDIEKHCMPR
ncbi:DUF3280 domain-containing protein [Chelativorans salis]|uniref:DUF3280 domain-containing protein n=1 Tax=Chelativorans salis TaxID=2978478 RepID=A0ABT2LL36_9HYPH|nr:DUF3280 domain-containing protein [Chelativorans sp. EGI FJ00035]MCT7374103.1 DUF3280 domain-containing protein [Chelativorans sp. EGI FJ00035]